MRRHHRRPTAVLLLYYIQAMIVSRALTVDVQSVHEIYSLCNTTFTNKTRVNDGWPFNTTGIFNGTTFFGDACFFNDTKTEWMSANGSILEPPPDVDHGAPWEYLVFFGMSAISALVGTVGNAAVVLAFCLYKKVRTTGNTFILNTSVWDLVTSAIGIPLVLSSTMAGQPNCGEACCAFIGFLSLFSVTQSLLSCALIAFNRYVHVVLPLATYKRLFGPVKAFLWVVGAWVTGTLTMFPAILGIYGSLGWDANVRICQLSNDPKSALFFKNVLSSLHWVAMLGISVFYIRIYMHVRKGAMTVGQHLGHSPQQVSLQAVKRTKHMFYIYFTLFTLTSPNIVIMQVDPHGVSTPGAVFAIVAMLYYWNTAVNPIIYTWTLKEFRQAFKSMARCRRHIVPAPPAPKPAVRKTVGLANFKVLSRLTVSNRVGQQAGPSMPGVNT